MTPSRALIHRLMRRIEAGRVTLVETFPGGERLEFGPRDAELRASAEVHDPAIYRRLALSKSLGLGSGYAAGLWDSERLLELLRILARDLRRADRVRRRITGLLIPFQRLGSLPWLNTRRGARDNIAAHYDLGNEMFELFLDRETMMYSSARYEHAGQTLEEAQRSRLDHVCRSLELGPDDHLLEIGTGWGGLAVHAAARYGCRVTTTTISRQQRDYAERRVAAAGLQERVRVIDSDYRDLRGSFDKLVSLEMIEAVGWEWFDAFFRQCSSLLTDQGLFFLQAIVVEDRTYEFEKRTRSFSELIFPGGCLPSVAAIEGSVGRETDLRRVGFEDISSSYVRTLAEWRERFKAATPQLGELGYDERFRRLWVMYLTMSEAGFRERRIRDVQMVFAKPDRSSVPPGGRASILASAAGSTPAVRSASE